MFSHKNKNTKKIKFDIKRDSIIKYTHIGNDFVSLYETTNKIIHNKTDNLVLCSCRNALIKGRIEYLIYLQKKKNIKFNIDCKIMTYYYSRFLKKTFSYLDKYKKYIKILTTKYIISKELIEETNKKYDNILVRLFCVGNEKYPLEVGEFNEIDNSFLFYFYIIYGLVNLKKNGNLIISNFSINTKFTADCVLLFSNHFEKYEIKKSDISNRYIIFKNYKKNVNKSQLEEYYKHLNTLKKYNNDFLNFNVFNKQIRKKYNLTRPIIETSIYEFPKSLISNTNKEDYIIFKKLNEKLFNNKLIFIKKVIEYFHKYHKKMYEKSKGNYFNFYKYIPLKIREKQLKQSYIYAYKYDYDLIDVNIKNNIIKIFKNNLVDIFKNKLFLLTKNNINKNDKNNKNDKILYNLEKIKNKTIFNNDLIKNKILIYFKKNKNIFNLISIEKYYNNYFNYFYKKYKLEKDYNKKFKYLKSHTIYEIYHNNKIPFYDINSTFLHFNSIDMLTKEILNFYYIKKYNIKYDLKNNKIIKGNILINDDIGRLNKIYKNINLIFINNIINKKKKKYKLNFIYYVNSKTLHSIQFNYISKKNIILTIYYKYNSIHFTNIDTIKKIKYDINDIIHINNNNHNDNIHKNEGSYELHFHIRTLKKNILNIIKNILIEFQLGSQNHLENIKETINLYEKKYNKKIQNKTIKKYNNKSYSKILINNELISNFDIQITIIKSIIYSLLLLNKTGCLIIEYKFPLNNNLDIFIINILYNTFNNIKIYKPALQNNLNYFYIICKKLKSIDTDKLLKIIDILNINEKYSDILLDKLLDIMNYKKENLINKNNILQILNELFLLKNKNIDNNLFYLSNYYKFKKLGEIKIKKILTNILTKTFDKLYN